MDEESAAPKSLLNWRIHAYPHYERGPLWYVVAGIVGGGLLIASIWTGNYLFAVLVLFAGAVVLAMSGRTPPEIDVEISPLGVRRGLHFYPYKSIKNFWIVYDPPIRSLNLVTGSIFGNVHIPIDDQDPSEVRDLLKNFLAEDLARDTETFSDMVSRILRI
jgi:hypothetical protein